MLTEIRKAIKQLNYKYLSTEPHMFHICADGSGYIDGYAGNRLVQWSSYVNGNSDELILKTILELVNNVE